VGKERLFESCQRSWIHPVTRGVLGAAISEETQVAGSVFPGILPAYEGSSKLRRQTRAGPARRRGHPPEAVHDGGVACGDSSCHPATRRTAGVVWAALPEQGRQPKQAHQVAVQLGVRAWALPKQARHRTGAHQLRHACASMASRRGHVAGLDGQRTEVLDREAARMVPLHAAAPLLHELRRARGVSPARSLVGYALEYVSTIDHQAQHLTTTRARRGREAPADAVGCATLMVDLVGPADDSKSAGGNPVRVRLSPRALRNYHRLTSPRRT